MIEFTWFFFHTGFVLHTVSLDFQVPIKPLQCSLDGPAWVTTTMRRAVSKVVSVGSGVEETPTQTVRPKPKVLEPSAGEKSIIQSASRLLFPSSETSEISLVERREQAERGKTAAKTFPCLQYQRYPFSQ